MKHIKTSLFTFATLILSGTFLIGVETCNPKLIEGPMPTYPEKARLHNTQGTVIIEALVDETGNVFAADVVKSVAADLDLAAVAAVSDWTFEPALKDGKPTMKVVRIPVNFNLIDPFKESLKDADNRAVAKN